MKKIAFILFGYPLGVSETIIQSLLTLARQGFAVDVYIDTDAFSSSPITLASSDVNIFVIQLKEVEGNNHFAGFVESAPKLGISVKFNKKYPRYPVFLQNILSKMANLSSYDLLVGVEPFGIVAAYLLSKLRKCPFIYYNMELFQRSNCNSSEALELKDLEIEASRNCLFTVIPDENRACVFLKENNVHPDSIRYLPISTSGDAIAEKGNYFRTKFNIPKGKKILIYAGHIADWALCYEIAESSRVWPDEYVLVFHSWQRHGENDPYTGKIKKTIKSNVYLSLEPLPRELFPMALSSADIGLLFYKPIDENFIEIGSSSNKLVQYLRAGLPVIACSFESIRKIFDQYPCGVCVPGPDGIPWAAEQIMSDYGSFRKESYRAFSEYYNFDRAFTSILYEIKDLLHRTQRVQSRRFYG